MEYNHEFNLSKKKITFLSLSENENKQTSETYSNILLSATNYRWKDVA